MNDDDPLFEDPTPEEQAATEPIDFGPLELSTEQLRAIERSKSRPGIILPGDLEKSAGGPLSPCP